VYEIQDKLSKQTILLVYFEGINYSGSFVINKNSFTFVKIENRKLTNRLSQIIIKQLNNEESSEDLISKTDCNNLYNELLYPFETQLEICKNIIFVPDGPLIGLPIEILKTNKNKYVIENWAVSYLFATKFLNLESNQIPKGNVFAFAPFVNKTEPFSNLYLPNSQNETASITDAKAFLGPAANKTNFISNMANAQVLHLATHAITNRAFAQKSYIQFYPNSSNNNESRLYMYELSAGVFQKNDLIFLSACDTFGGETAEGEGIIGLSRAFYMAGSKNIVSSLWKAEDHTSAYLTSRFYYYLSKGNSYSLALQNAKIDLLENPEYSQFKEPKYWSNFILIGNQNTQTGCLSKKYLFLIIVAIATCLFVLAYNNRYFKVKILSLSKNKLPIASE
jgi:CHAT domain-containing protein